MQAVCTIHPPMVSERSPCEMFVRGVGRLRECSSRLGTAPRSPVPVALLALQPTARLRRSSCALPKSKCCEPPLRFLWWIAMGLRERLAAPGSIAHVSRVRRAAAPDASDQAVVEESVTG
jgi:hypothetical protein